MEIEIHPSALIDSPYERGTEQVFSFDEIQLDNLVKDLTYGHPSCYLVSGYRGVGKTSLIKSVEGRIQQGTQQDEVIFVYTGLTGFSKGNHLIRKLVRELFLRIEKSKKFQDLKENIDDSEDFKDLLTLLYARTFNEVSETNESNSSTERQWLLDLSFKDLLIELLKQLSPLLLLLVMSTPLYENLSYNYFIDWVLPIGSVLWALLNLVKAKYSLTKKSRRQKNLLIKSLYDEEIAETLFLSILRSAKKKGFNIVFVLDELDKADPEQIDSIVSELKVFLLSGYASFLVVGGQDFYYKYRHESDLDDSILSSLFSRVYHVPISTSVILRDFFYRTIVKPNVIENLDPNERTRIEELVDYLIFKSRLIPRRFITGVRQHVSWRGNQAFLTDRNFPLNLSKYKGFINAIDKLDDTKVAPDHSGAVRDFIIMQMYITILNDLKYKAK